MVFMHFSILHLRNKKPSSVLKTAILLLFFSPGEWTQILGVFSSRGNVKAPLLSKLLLEAMIMAEKCGLQVDYWTSDGAPWNRSLSKLVGIKGRLPHSIHLHKIIYTLFACFRLHNFLACCSIISGNHMQGFLSC